MMPKSKRQRQFFYIIPYGIWLVLFVIAPLVLLVFQSLTTPTGHFTLHNYAIYFASGTYLRMTFNSVWYAFLITAVTLIVSYPMAYLLNQLKQKQFWLLLIILPTWINLLLKTYAFIGLLSKSGTVNNFIGLWGVVPQQLLFSDWSFLLVAAYIEIPFMILPIFNSLAEINPRLEQASRDLGANRWQTLRRVIVPLSMPGVKAGIQAVFIPSLSLFMITRLIGGNRVITLGTAIEEHFLVTQNWQLGSTIGVVLIVAMVITMILTRDRARRSARKGR
ncbi:MAG: ABC-type spermidine/putrescine transport system, permease component I [Leuconostoc sp. DORA_2]|jgi:spermidine/putrescine transport system permease protein|uniref:ABC-type spermidine/putrescine transport system, permease component I n=3 Tax=Lactobacillaceae TaxID=33958 RepID=B1MW18_LEUCK|nr:ABC-type spermidine/putrescine transport system, permease component I [Leuconostoc citreum KM20]ETI98687.1 MAG: ABC-type spermidine/putrescine transport system, permease component I [Leuconostoc sp. DORA_2]GDZ84197.1 spermidine/putrescine ABC transporter permease [Leuconostoc citreum]GEK62017.1 spermidine/putrescine ABC transporter permease [Leuconostoc citreum]